MSTEADETPPTTDLDTHVTTTTLQAWVATEITAVQDLIVKNGGVRFLSPELKALAEQAGVNKRGWPRWLVLGVGMRGFRRWLESEMASTESPKPKRAPR